MHFRCYQRCSKTCAYCSDAYLPAAHRLDLSVHSSNSAYLCYPPVKKPLHSCRLLIRRSEGCTSCRTLSFSCVSRTVLPSAFFLQLCPSLRKKRKVFRLKRNTLPPANCVYTTVTRTSLDAIRICSADVRTLRSIGRLL